MSDDQDGSKKEMPAVSHVHGMLPLDAQVQAPIVKFMKIIRTLIDDPVVWFREKVVEKNRGEPYPYYHRKFNRVPTIDQCYMDDMACIYEANEQYARDRRVDFEIIKILRQRYFRCSYYERAVNEWYDLDKICQKEKKDLADAELNLFIKYGELGPYANVVDAFMKQKHRLIWERRQAEKATKASH